MINFNWLWNLMILKKINERKEYKEHLFLRGRSSVAELAENEGVVFTPSFKSFDLSNCVCKSLDVYAIYQVGP